MEYDEIITLVREHIVHAKHELKSLPMSRGHSVTNTKLDEAILWLSSIDNDTALDLL